MTRDAIAEILEKIGLVLEMQGENPFKTRAYKNAAEIVLSYPGDIIAMARDGKLDEVAGLGVALVEKITALVNTGKLEYWEKLKAPYPESFFELFNVPGLGPKKIKALYDALQVDGIAALRTACEAGKVASLSGFGAKTEAKLKEALKYAESSLGKVHRDTATVLVEEVLELLRQHPDVLMAESAGSYRRGKEIMGDLDFLVATANPSGVCTDFAAAEMVKEVIAHGDTKVSVRLAGGVQADLRAVSNESYPFALQYFTGSKEHNVALRGRARKMGWSLNEYGFTALEDNGTKVPNVYDESGIYRALDLDPIPAELRENLGEIEAAETHTLPRLIEWTELRGTFHNHTTASDGTASLEAMAEAAIELGLSYLGIADHSKSSVQANGLREDRVRTQMAEIRELNAKYSKDRVLFRLFAGSEVDIMKDGRLDFDDVLLSELDYVVASVHSSFTLSEEDQTERIIKAMENPHVDMIGHLTGRLLLRREPYAVNYTRIIEAAARTRTVIELNANPWRLDMDWRHWRTARDLGVLCAINPDAHCEKGLQDLRFGVDMARKGWLRKADVLNTRDSKAVEEWLATPKAER